MLFPLKAATSTILALTIGSTVAITTTSLASTHKDVLSASMVAQTPRETPKRKVKKDGVMEQLNLNEDQKRQISGIRKKYQERLTQLRTNVQTAQKELESLMTGNASNDQIRTQYQQVTQLRQELYQLNFESMLEMRQVLNPSQRSQLSQLMQQRHQQMRQRSGDGLNNEDQ